MLEHSTSKLEVSAIVGQSISDGNGNYVYYQLSGDVFMVLESKIKDADFDTIYHKWQRVFYNIIAYFEKVYLDKEA